MTKMKHQQEDISCARFFRAQPINSGVLSSILVILETGHSGQARVQQSVCRLPDQIVVKGNSHMNVIHAQAQA